MSTGDSAPLVAAGRDVSAQPAAAKQEDDKKVVCLVLFLGFIGFMGWMTYYSHKFGNIQKLTHGIDWTGELCGVDENVSTKPFLYWCGTGNFQEIKDPSTGAVVAEIPMSLNLMMPICVDFCPSISAHTVYCPQQTASSMVQTFPTGDKNEPTWTQTQIIEVKGQESYATIASGQYCLPDLNINMGGNATAAMEALQGQIDEYVDSSSAMALMNMFSNLAKDVPNLMPLLVLICISAFVLSFNYLLMLRCFAEPLVYGVLILSSLSFLGAGSACISTAYDLTGSQKLSPLFSHRETFGLQNDQQSVIVSTIAGSVFLVLGFVIAICTCCMRETIKLVCGCTEAACEAIFDMPTLLLEPVLGAAIKLFLLIDLLYGFAWLVTVGKIEGATLGSGMGGSPQVSGVGRSFTYTEDERRMLFLWIFGTFWIMEVCDACQQFTVSYAVVLWYYKPKAEDGDKKGPWFPVVRGFFNAIVFHLGTLAFGGLLIAVVRMIQLVMWLVKKNAEREGNQVCACIMKCCICCLECFKKSLEYLNKNAYIDVAIHSSNFCQAAYHVFNFIKDHAADIVVLNAWTWIIQVGGVLCITSAGGYGTYFLTTKVDRWASETSKHHVSEPTLLAMLAGLFCFCVSAVFMWVFDQCIDTVLYVYADNRKNSPDTLHIYAPDLLAETVEAHNKKHKEDEAATKRDTSDE